jgi:hypothetical protein
MVGHGIDAEHDSMTHGSISLLLLQYFFIVSVVRCLIDFMPSMTNRCLLLQWMSNMYAVVRPPSCRKIDLLLSKIPDVIESLISLCSPDGFFQAVLESCWFLLLAYHPLSLVFQQMISYPSFSAQTSNAYFNHRQAPCPGPQDLQGQSLVVSNPSSTGLKSTRLVAPPRIVSISLGAIDFLGCKRP